MYEPNNRVELCRWKDRCMGVLYVLFTVGYSLYGMVLVM